MTNTMAPVPGSRRDANRKRVRVELAKHSRGLTYHDLAVLTGLSHPAVCRACDDLRYHDGSVMVGIPAYGNGWRVVLGWKPGSKIGEKSQAGHNGTRLLREATRFETAAAAEKDVGLALAMRMAAGHLRQTAKDLQALAL